MPTGQVIWEHPINYRVGFLQAEPALREELFKALDGDGGVAGAQWLLARIATGLVSGNRYLNEISGCTCIYGGLAMRSVPQSENERAQLAAEIYRESLINPALRSTLPNSFEVSGEEYLHVDFVDLVGAEAVRLILRTGKARTPFTRLERWLLDEAREDYQTHETNEFLGWMYVTCQAYINLHTTVEA